MSIRQIYDRYRGYDLQARADTFMHFAFDASSLEFALLFACLRSEFTCLSQIKDRKKILARSSNYLAMMDFSEI